MTLKEFVRNKLNCSYDDAELFISKFRHYDAVEYGRNILENHEDDFKEGFDIDSIEEETLAKIAIGVENKAMSDLSSIEDSMLEEYFPFEYC